MRYHRIKYQSLYNFRSLGTKEKPLLLKKKSCSEEQKYQGCRWSTINCGDTNNTELHKLIKSDVIVHLGWTELLSWHLFCDDC